MIYITKFRSNDLHPSKGKQIEFNTNVAKSFFNFTDDKYDIAIECHSLSNILYSSIIKAELRLSPARGDYKIYQNTDGTKDLKDVFLEDLKLSSDINMDDYFALKKKDNGKFIMYYIPRDLLFSDFFKVISGDQIIFYDENVPENLDTNDLLVYQKIFYGAPGTGKSHAIKELTEGESVIRTTFHPDSDYSTFVGAYKPTMGLLPICDELGQPMKIGSTVLHKEQIIYEFVDQAFLQAYVNAWKFYAENSDATKNQYLVIEEINRGNCAQIFGDLFQLLDRNDYGFSVYPINADKDMKKQLAKAFKKDGKTITIEGADKINALYKGKDVVSQVLSGDILLLPDNLYIWATMNTSDQSLFPIDSAFKRRWEWQYMPIDKGYDANGQEIKWAIEGATKKYDWWSFLDKINAQIGEATQSEDKKLGFFFCKASDGVISAEKFVGKVIFYLWNDVFKNNGFEGPIFKDVDGTELSFSKFYNSDSKGNTIVQKDKVELFLTNLGVDVFGEQTNVLESDTDNDADDNEDGNEKVRLTIKFPDGEIVAGNTKFDSYIAALRKIGFERAEQVAAEKKYHRQGCALISKSEEQGILDAANYSYIQEQGFYIVKGMNGKTMRNMLNLLSQKFNLQLEVVYE